MLSSLSPLVAEATFRATRPIEPCRAIQRNMARVVLTLVRPFTTRLHEPVSDSAQCCADVYSDTGRHARTPQAHDGGDEVDGRADAAEPRHEQAECPHASPPLLEREACRHDPAVVVLAELRHG